MPPRKSGIQSLIVPRIPERHSPRGFFGSLLLVTLSPRCSFGLKIYHTPVYFRTCPAGISKLTILYCTKYLLESTPNQYQRYCTISREAYN